MICCKIVANYKQICLQFANIFKELNKIGDVLWDNNYFYFANTTDNKIGDKNVRKILRKYGCEVFILEYGKDSQPQENDNVNHWVEDRLIKIGYKEFEDQQQTEIQIISNQLTDLNNMLTELKQKQAQLETENKK